MEKAVRRLRKRSSEITSLLAEFRHSEMSVKDFCVHRSLHPANFYKWMSRSKTRTISRSKKRGGFAPVEITTGTAQAPMLFAEFKGIKFYQPVSAEYLKLLIQ